MSIETIDFQSIDAAEHLVDSLSSSGFAVLENHPIDQGLLGDIYMNWLAFFNSSEKQDYLFDPLDKNKTQEGYYPPEAAETALGADIRDLKEYFHIVETAPLPPLLKTQILTYREQTFALGKLLLAWLQENTPKEVTEAFPLPLTDVLSTKDSLLRVLHYPPLKENEKLNEQLGAVRAAPHEDINLITILPASNQAGLQVKTLTGDWIDIQAASGSLVINNGDMLQELSQNFYPSTTHQVLNPKRAEDNVSRISLPFFLTPKLDYKLSDRYTAGSYLAERLALLMR